MKRNFYIRKEIELHVDGKFYDLKNFYSFRGLDLDARTGKVRLIFEGRSQLGNTDPAEDLIKICFDGVTYIYVSEFFVAKANTELLRIGFKKPMDSDIDWLLSDEQSDQNDHLLFCLGNDEYIRLCAEAVNLEKG